MSHEAINWAWNCDLPCAQRMVLMVLGDCFHIDTPDACFPSHATIAARAGLSRKHVMTCLADLEAAGFISIYGRQRDNGGMTSCSYVLHMPSQKAPSAKVAPMGFVYVATCDGATKVGITRDVEARLKGLRTANPKPIALVAQFEMPMRAARAVEEAVLAHFAEDRLAGEWLATPCDDVVAQIEAHLQDVVGGVSPEVTGGVTRGDMHNIEPKTINSPLPQNRPEPSAQDVVQGRSVHAIAEEQLYRTCCDLTSRNPHLTDRSGGWFFSFETIREARLRIDQAILGQLVPR